MRLSLPFNVQRWMFNVGRFLLMSFIASFVRAQPQDLASGYGPPTAVPPNESITRPVVPPARNWIDQTQAPADAKSFGCNQCHKGIEPMHAAPHVVLGCTDCHGGNPARGLTKEQAHVPPRNPEFLQNLGQSPAIPTSGSITNRRSSSAS